MAGLDQSAVGWVLRRSGVLKLVLTSSDKLP